MAAHNSGGSAHRVVSATRHRQGVELLATSQAGYSILDY